MKIDGIYDVVDRKGYKIGEAIWMEAHSKGFLHQCVHGIVFRDENKKNVNQKRSNINPQGTGQFGIAVAGHIISGYTPQESIEKETKEELLRGKHLPKSIKIKKTGSYFNHDLPNNYEIAYLFEIIYPGLFFKSEESEGDAFWIGWSELVEDMKINSKKYAQYSVNAVMEYSKKVKK